MYFSPPFDVAVRLIILIVQICFHRRFIPIPFFDKLNTINCNGHDFSTGTSLLSSINDLQLNENKL